MIQYIVGTQIQLSAQFKNEDGVEVDVDQVSMRIIDPSETTLNLDSLITRLGVGLYAVDFVPDQSGLYIYRFFSEGLVKAAGEGDFTAQTSFPYNVVRNLNSGSLSMQGADAVRNP